eukprot:g1802.t1
MCTISYTLFVSDVPLHNDAKKLSTTLLERLQQDSLTRSETPLILSMTMSNLIQHVNQLIGAAMYLNTGYSHSGTWCQVQAFVEQMFPLSTSLWALCIGITVYRLIVYKTQSENIYLYFHLLCWGFPLGLSVFGSIKHMYGEAGSWCWVSSEKNQILMQYVEMIGIFILILGIYVRVLWWTISSQSVGSSRMRQRYKEDVQRILWFPLVFLIAWSGGLINRLYSTLHDESYALNILMYITIPSCGWLNAIAYAVTNNDIQIMYSKMFPCCRRHRRGKDPSSPDSMSNGQSTV